MENTALKNTEFTEQETTTEATSEAVEQTQPEEKLYTFRRLETSDLFLMLKLLKKIGLKDLKENENMKNFIFMFMGGTVKGKIDVNQLGVDMFLEVACLLCDSIPKAEDEIYNLLASTSNRSVKEIKKQDMAVTFEMIVDFVKKEEFMDFFKAVSKLF
jgi:hypothetical protein